MKKNVLPYVIIGCACFWVAVFFIFKNAIV
jgi:hypothetical protein